MIARGTCGPKLITNQAAAQSIPASADPDEHFFNSAAHPPTLPSENNDEESLIARRLADGRRPYPERLRILRDALAPTLDRRAFANGEVLQDHFAAPEHGWRLTYETAYGHQIRIAYPPDDEATARALMLDAVECMGCEVLKIMTHRGEPAWT